MKKISLAIVAMLFAIGSLDGMKSRVQAQNFDLGIYDYDQFQQNDLDDLVEPILQFFGSIGGAGFVNTAKLHDFGGFDIGVRIVGTVIPDEFSGAGKLFPDNQGGFTTPFINEDLLGFPFFTASLGLFSNLEVMARAFHYPLGDDPLRESVTLLGGGVKYGLVQTGLIPKITIIGGYQVLMVPEEFDFGTVKIISAKAFASKDIAIITLYGGGGIDRTFLTIDVEGLPGDFDTEFDATNTHGTVGLTATVFPLIRVNGEYNFGTFNSFTIGASLSIR